MDRNPYPPCSWKMKKRKGTNHREEEEEIMASTLGVGFSSSTSTWIPSSRAPLITSHSSALNNRRISISSSSSSSSSSLRSSLPPISRKKWGFSATTESVALDQLSEPEPVEAQIASAVASENPKTEEVFAVVMIGSRQYIVFPGRFIYTQRLKGANVNDKIILNKVLLVGTKTNVYIGEPVVQNAVVHAVVEEQGLDRKVIVFKYKPRKNYRRTIGHRQPNTRIRITGITGYHDAPADAIPA